MIKIDEIKKAIINKGLPKEFRISPSSFEELYSKLPDHIEPSTRIADVEKGNLGLLFAKYIIADDSVALGYVNFQ